MKLKSRKRVLLSCLILLAIFFVFAIYYARVSYLRSVDSLALVHKEVESKTPDILRDLEIVRKNPPFPALPRTRNAHSLIAKHLSWDSLDTEPFDSLDHHKLRTLADKYPNWRNEIGQEKQLMSDPLLDEIDTTWVGELSQYDYWKFHGDETFSESIEGVSSLNGVDRLAFLSSTPTPNFLEYQRWVGAYFLQKMKIGKKIEALKTFRHAAQLAQSTHTLVGSMVAVGMLAMESEYVTKHHIERWTAVTEESRLALGAVSWAWVSIVSTADFGKWNPVFEPYMKSQYGFCGGISTTFGLNLYQDMFKPQFPFEADFSKDLEVSKEARLRFFKHCDLDELAITQSEVTPVTNIFTELFFPHFGDHGKGIVLGIITHIPYFRRVLAVSMLALTSPSFLRAYQTKPQ